MIRRPHPRLVMSFFLPPSAEDFRRNAQLLAAEWKAGSTELRYFIASQLLSGLLLGACSLASIAAGIAGLDLVHRGLLGAAGLCLVLSLSTWDVLKRRFQVRYEVW